ncbi:hypothetical protein H6P81_009179 [Aristolochia fimbriata]|uniref:Proline-rich protein PRCC n=1 Tax=Aristolochia fimbriata TaxID=158543 RepID=A0AAV7ELG9_ARIFI|nr:hypothetical protein H6P81_009179 [Aristolochia fimbriata]
MDSLLANYGSSDDEEQETGLRANRPSLSTVAEISSLSSALPAPKKSSSILSSLPPPEKSSSFSVLSSLPPPKSSSSSSSLNPFSLPPPKSQQSSLSKFDNSGANAKKVFQFRPPINPFASNLEDDDDDEEEERKKKAKVAFSSTTEGNSLGSKPFLLPPPKHSLSLAPPLGSSSARRVVVDADVPATTSKTSNVGQETSSWGSGNQNFDGYGETYVDGLSYASSKSVPGNESYGGYGNYEGSAPLAPASEATSLGPGNDNYSSYESSYGDGSIATTSAPAGHSVGPLMGNFGKRGKNDVPADIVEVKQDDLISNRPREDQVKLTGIAFGPAYRPVSTTKGKPSKLHKRKHQIGSLFYDMKQKEMELAERRAKGFLTKAETQAKYGW